MIVTLLAFSILFNTTQIDINYTRDKEIGKYAPSKTYILTTEEKKPTQKTVKKIYVVPEKPKRIEIKPEDLNLIKKGE